MNGKLGFAAGAVVGACLTASVGSLAQSALSDGALRKLSEIFDVVKENFAGETDERRMYDGCNAGLLRAIDDQSAYVSVQELRDLTAPRGSIGGIGLELAVRGGVVTVVSPIEGAPAERGGILPGDLIVKVDSVETSALPLADVVKALRGPAGSRVSISIARQGASEVKQVMLVREVIRVNPVRAQLLQPGTAYLRLTQFTDQAPAMPLKAAEDLRAKNGAPLARAVLDLRGNPGGLLNSGLEVATLFLPPGAVIVSTNGRNAESRQIYTANSSGHRSLPQDFRSRVPELATIPLVVLVDAGTASSSEIVAASLQDGKRAVLVGEHTFGRGSIQTIYPLADDSAIKFTTGWYYGPGGRTIHLLGLDPDVKVAPATRGALTSYGDGQDVILKRALEVLASR